MASAMKGNPDKRSSTIRIQPTFKPPVLGDEGKSSRDIKEFFDKFDDMCNLANDGKGMLPMERLQTLATCLKGTKEKIYKLLVDKHRKLGSLERDPDKVFEVVRTRLMKFSESDLERQMRVKGEWDQLWKGQRTGLEFEASFEEAITELELAGLGKSCLDLKLDYLSKVGVTLAAEILKDSRLWENEDGSKSVRKVESWEECHKVLLELEAVKAGGRALQGSYGISDGVMKKDKRIKELENQLAQAQAWGGAAKGDHPTKGQSKGDSKGKGKAKPPCFEEAKGKRDVPIRRPMPLQSRPSGPEGIQ